MRYERNEVQIERDFGRVALERRGWRADSTVRRSHLDVNLKIDTVVARGRAVRYLFATSIAETRKSRAS
jgi:hypothetical protein